MPPSRDGRLAVEELFKGKSPEEQANAYTCTVVSLLPITLEEHKPHLFPSVFVIPAAEKGGMILTYVGEAHHFVSDPFDEKKNFKQLTSPHEMARSICEDYNTSHIGTDSDSGPGLFWLPGRLSEETIRDRHSKTLALHAERQNKWFHNLVAIADADWERNHNRLAVSDLQRIAAQHLGIQKDWVQIRAQENISCPFCKAMIANDSIKCFNCKEIVDMKRYKELTEGTGNK